MRLTRVFVGLFKARLLLAFWLTRDTVVSGQLWAPNVVRGTFGGSVTVPCRYNPQYRDYTKYWCRGHVYELCNIVVKAPKDREGTKRASIADDPVAGVFTVTMTALQAGDEDTYWCVIARSGRNIHTAVKLFLSYEVKTPTTAAPTERDTIRWWATLRWILLAAMFGCLALTHVAVRRMRGVKNMAAAISPSKLMRLRAPAKSQLRTRRPEYINTESKKGHSGTK